MIDTTEKEMKVLPPRIIYVVSCEGWIAGAFTNQGAANEAKEMILRVWNATGPTPRTIMPQPLITIAAVLLDADLIPRPRS